MFRANELPLRQDSGPSAKTLVPRKRTAPLCGSPCSCPHFSMKNDTLKVPPDKKTSWGKRERYSFGYAVFLILALMK